MSEAERGPRGRKLFTVFSILVFLVSHLFAVWVWIAELLSHFLFLFFVFFLLLLFFLFDSRSLI